MSRAAEKIIKKCPSCGKIFFRMRRCSYPPYRTWELRAKYCSDACRQYAYRKRRMMRTFPA
jgi:hypothetical protein